MPPKRRAAPTATAADTKPKKRPSKLAKENNITAEQESEIREAFDLFAQPSSSPPSKETLLPTSDVRRCLIALNTPPTSASELADITSTLDPSDSGSVTFAHFLAVAALKLHARVTGSSAEAQEAEVDAAFQLFTRGEGQVITLEHLRRVARELREDVGDATLKDMLREANGGPAQGVGRDEFESVMRRAGVFG